MAAREPVIHQNSDNIFVGLGVAEPQTHMLEAEIVTELYRLTSERKLTQTEACKLMGLSQPEVSRLFKGTFREYSVERLMCFLTSFDRDVEIISRPHAGAGKAGISYTVQHG